MKSKHSFHLPVGFCPVANQRGGASLWFISLSLVCAALCLPGQAAAPDTNASVPGVVIDYVPAASGQYVGSPSIAVLTNGDYVASHDYFGTNASQQVSVVFGSSDRGSTWHRLTELDGQWWSGLFVHRGALYIMGTSRHMGNVVIRRSTDGGRTWTTPRDAKTGLLLAGRYHTSSVPPAIHQGRIWRAMETLQYGAFIMSAPLEADLLDAGQWKRSEALPSPPGYNGWREGNAVITPEGNVVDIIRVHVAEDKASILHLSPDGKILAYDPTQDLIDFPGGSVKFTIRFDPQTRRYWALVNKQKDPAANRNLLALVSSSDLRHWETKSTLLRHEDRKNHAFQYVDWLFDGEDIIAASRTAWDGSHNAHDANYLTFHRFEKFRGLP